MTPSEYLGIEQQGEFDEMPLNADLLFAFCAASIFSYISIHVSQSTELQKCPDQGRHRQLLLSSSFSSATIYSFAR
jgi:hypothetical protein